MTSSDGQQSRIQQSEPPVVATTEITRQSSSLRSCLIAGCSVTGAILLFLGLVGWLGYRAVQNSKGVTHYHESQIPMGGNMPDWVKDDLLHGEPVELEQVAGLQEFLDQLADGQLREEEAIDYRRAALEMEASGLCTEVNWLTRRLWARRIDEAMSLPDLGRQFEVLGLEWTVPEKELRLCILVDWYSSHGIAYVYLCNSKGKWQVYDHRDPVSSMSDVQYLAVYAHADDGNESNLSEMHDRQQEIRDLPDTDVQEKSRLAIRAFRENQYSDEMRWVAIENTLAWLNDYENPDATRELLLEPDNGDFIGLELYRAEMFLWQDKKADAFRAAMQVLERMSWHPEATRLAFLAAETPEEVAQISDAFMRLRHLLPHAGQRLFADASDRQLASWSQYLSQTSEGAVTLFSLLDDLNNKSQFMALRRVMIEPETPTQELLLNYLTIRCAALGEELQYQQAANAIMQSPVQSLLEVDPSIEPGEISAFERLRRQIVYLMSTHDELLSLPEIDTDQRLLRSLRGRLSLGYGVRNWKHALEVILSSGQPFLSQAETKVALGCIYKQLDRPEQAWHSLTGAWQEIRASAMTEECPDYVSNLLEALSNLAIESNRVAEYCSVIENPELTLLTLFDAMKSRRQWQNWKELGQWYLEKASQPDAWYYLVESHYQYAQGDWRAADETLPKAIDLAREDSRFESKEFPAAVQDWVPYDSSPNEWSEFHGKMAVRSGNFLTWMKSRQDDPDAMVRELQDIVWRLQYTPYSKLVENVLTELESELTNSDRPRNYQVEGWTHSLRASLALQQEDYAEAVEQRVLELQHQDDTEDTLPSALRYALYYQVDLFRWKSQLEELARENSSTQESLRQALAICSGKSDEFLQSIQSNPESDSIHHWKYRLGIDALIKAGLWKDYNRIVPLSVDDINTLSAVPSIMVFDRTVTEISEQISEKLKEAYQGGMQTIPLKSFPQAVGAWTIEIAQRSFLLVAYDRSSLVENTTGLDTLDNYPGIIAISPTRSPNVYRDDIELRAFVSDLGEVLPGAVGYFDYVNDSRFVGDSWQTQLKENAHTGFNPRDFEYYTVDFYRRDETDPAALHDSILIRSGLILEKVGVVENETSATDVPPSQTVRSVELESAPFLCPQLSAGDRLNLEL